VTARGGTAHQEETTIMTDIAGLPDYDTPQGPIPETGEIKIKLVRTNVFTRWPCSVCLGCTEKVEVLAEGPGGLRVCERCLKCGDIDGHLEQRAAALEQDAKETRALIGRLKVPTYDEWLHATDCCNADFAGCSVAKARADRLKEEKDWEAEMAEHKAKVAADLTDDSIPF
jgi:hypothetical protein